ncbi:sirohydrochlorin chelatase [Neobacillus soli]|uniref:sirohydrochlorin chelatase n=1 Tax=Neobacillus soli TaxID=220688 RepID=UPI000825CE55|nr:sirohydrochlorin chelatase [Neobacillus soli]
MKATIYIGHGSRRAEANEKFISFIKKVMQPSTAVIQAFGFLEHAEPSIAQAVETCIKQGASEITVVPVFLLPGIHANKDIPAQCKSYPDIVFRYGKPLGADEMMVEILGARLTAAGFEKRESEAVLLVGHGSREPAAAVEFEKLAQRMAEKIGQQVHTSYVTTPVFYHDMAAKFVDKKVYILPYFLFSGGYTVKMKKELDGASGDIIFCHQVGFDARLIPLIQKRAGEAREYEGKLSDYAAARREKSSGRWRRQGC